MAISKYSTPARATIQRTQVLPDIGFMSKQLEKRQQAYDINSQNLQATQGQLSGLTGIGKAANRDIRAIDSKFAQMTQELLKKDLGDPRLSKQVREEIYSLKNNPALNKHITAKAAYDNYQKKVAELSENGDIPKGNLWEYEKAWMNYSETGEFNQALTNPTIVKGVDRLKESKALFEQIKASGSQSLASIDSLAGKVYYENGWKGVSGKQIDQAVKNNLDIMMTSNLGRELTKEWNMLNEQNNGKGLPAKSAVEYVYNTLKGVGSTYVHGDTTSNISTALNKAGDLNREVSKAKKEEEGFSLDSESFVSGKYGTEPPKFKSDGSIEGKGKDLGDLWNESTGVFNFASKLFSNDSLEPKERGKIENQRLIVQAKLNGVTPKQVLDKLASDRTVEYKAFSKNSDAEDLSKRLFDEGSGWIQNLQVVTRDGKTKPGLAAIAESLGLDTDASPAEISEAVKSNKVKAVGYAAPNEHSKYGVMLSVNGHNMIAKLDPYVTLKNFSDEQRFKIDLEWAAARADAGYPTKVKVPTGETNKDGTLQMETKYLYKDINSGRVLPLDQTEFNKRIKDN